MIHRARLVVVLKWFSMYRKSQGGLSIALMSATSLKHPMKKMATTGDKCMSRNIATPPRSADTQR